MLGEQKNFMPDIIMAVCDLGTICRQDRKWGPDLVSQLYMHYWLPSLSYILEWQKNYIHDIIIVVVWLGYNLQTRARFGISSFSALLT